MATIELGVGLYSPRVAARIARIKYQNFQAWAKASLLHGRKFPIGKRGESIYTYHDLLLIRLIVRLKEQGARPKQIKTALNTIEVMSGGDPNAWLRATILFDIESRVVVAVLIVCRLHVAGLWCYSRGTRPTRPGAAAKSQN